MFMLLFCNMFIYLRFFYKQILRRGKIFINLAFRFMFTFLIWDLNIPRRNRN